MQKEKQIYAARYSEVRHSLLLYSISSAYLDTHGVLVYKMHRHPAHDYLGSECIIDPSSVIHECGSVYPRERAVGVVRVRQALR
jgi:hypothetical protein